MERSVIGESVQGASHIRNNKECQDNYRKIVLEDGCIIIAVADGHGSESCPFSKSGSMIAVNTFCRLVDELHTSYLQSLDSLQTYFNREGEIKFAQAIDREWKQHVLKAHTNAKRDAPLLSSGMKDKDAIYKQYGTTLLGLFIAKEYVFAFQIGDGDIMMVNSSQVDSVIQSNKILGVETHSLCKNESWKSACSTVCRLDSTLLPCVFMLSTDGFSNSYLNDDEFHKSCHDYFELMQEHGTEAIASHLKEWLSDTSAKGCGDDITTVFAHIIS
ncbi:MAG: PP2C family serine/threonine-protein phosphatase [Eubacteriales bacterium]|nr:PP2C family serine/threonine-protein phosphatase [Eubacteriales bacterium]